MPQMTPVQRRVLSLVFSLSACGGDNAIIEWNSQRGCMMGTLLGANCRKSMELGRFMCHGMIDLWFWNNGVYGVGVGWFMRALGANCKSNLLIGDLHCCCCVWARACSLIYRPVFCNTPASGGCSALDSWTPALLIFSLFLEEDTILEHVRFSLTG